MGEQTNSLRYQLHVLIGLREKAEKGGNMGNSKRQADYLIHKKEVEDFLKKHPELESEVETIEEHFFKKLYT